MGGAVHNTSATVVLEVSPKTGNPQHYRMPENIIYHQKTKGIAGIGNIGSNHQSINNSMSQGHPGDVYI